jgi:Tol biopolymer transport system component/DNA-binding winged helix-turn-helix (wHTH) protein
MSDGGVRDRFVYEFGEVRVDMGRMAALRGDTAIPLEPKAFDVLVHLIEHRNRVVTKDELLDTVWTGTFVTPNVLTRAVAQIRKALADEAEHGQYIETVAKRGYRFVAPVTVAGTAGAMPGTGSALPAVEPLPQVSGRSAPPVTADPARGSARRRVAGVLMLGVAAAGAILAAVSLTRQRAAAPDAPAAELHLKRLTNRRGYTGMPALSPDGRSVVYASDVSGGVELYRASLLQGGGELALTKDGGRNIQPAWSPDGQWIAFHSRVRGGVWIVPANGGVPQQVAEFGSDPAWSPDSQTLAFTSDAGGLAAQSSLWTVRRDGTERRALTRVGTPPGGHRAPAWSHDGRHVAFVVGTGGWRIQIWTVDVASGVQRLIDTSTNTSDPVFAPGDRALLWGGSTSTGNGRLFRHAVDDEAGPVGSTEVVLPMDGGTIDGLSVAADGTLAFAAGTLDGNLWATDLTAGGRGSEPVRLTDDVSRNTHPHYSRDGRVTYMQTAVGSLPSAWMMRDDGTGRMPLLPGTGAGHPQWDADARRILIWMFNEGVSRGLDFAWVDVASRRLTPAGLSGQDMANPRLSPDGRELAFHRIEKDGAVSVWVTRFDGTRTQIATDPEAVSYPAWSPDGQFLAVEIKRGDSTQVGVVARAGGPIELLTSARGQSGPHSGSPDTDRITFAGERDGVWNLYTVSRRTRVVTQVTSFTSGSGYVRYPAWSPAGSRIIFERAMESANVWTMNLPAPGPRD